MNAHARDAKEIDRILAMLVALICAWGCGTGPSASAENDPSASSKNDAGVSSLDAALDSGSSSPGDVAADSEEPEDSAKKCDPGACPPTGKPCTTATCTAGKCDVAPLSGVSCDDGDVCTKVDLCDGGKCVGVVNVCGQCAIDADCQAKDDNNLCNGTTFCDQTATPPLCKLNPATIVVCAPTTEACSTETCDAATGKCSKGDVGNGSPCDDGDICTVFEKCVDGACESELASVCECESDADCPTSADVCAGTRYCDKTAKPHVCATNPGSKISCDKTADGPCESTLCVPLSGACTKVAAADTTSCDDGDACSVGDGCKGGKCVSGTDQCPCTKDLDCAVKEDGNACNGSLICNKASGECVLNQASIITCPTVDDTDCRQTVCATDTGKCELINLADGKGCSDGDECTGGGGCKDGECAATVVLCKCKNNAECNAKFDDGNLCNGVWYCDKNTAIPECKLNPASKVHCPIKDNTDCLKSACDPVSGACGMKPSAKGDVCDDGNACTEKDACAAGACGGDPISCDDQNACTADSCDNKNGCVHEAKSCDDGNACTADLCDSKSGACKQDAASLNDKPCDADKSGCTVNDACASGVCKAGTPAACKVPDSACQVAVCVSQTSSTFVCGVAQAKDGLSCDDSKSCYYGAVCEGGQCGIGPKQKLNIETLKPAANGATKPTGGWLRSVAAVANGQSVAVGGWTSATSKGWWWVRVHSDGAPNEQIVGGPLGTHDSLHASGVVGVGGGGFVTTGTTEDATTGLRATRLIARGGQNKVVWQQDYPHKTGHSHAAGLARYIDGTLAVAGSTEAAGKRAATLWRVSKSGSVLAVHTDVAAQELTAAAFFLGRDGRHGGPRNVDQRRGESGRHARQNGRLNAVAARVGTRQRRLARGGDHDRGRAPHRGRRAGHSRRSAGVASGPGRCR